MNTIDFTVAIRTFNGADRLPLILDQLRSQINVSQIHWEVVIVDNNSRDRTAEIIRHYQDHWLDSCELRYIFEPEQGAAIARKRAILESRGDLIGFLDDDNVPASDWVAVAYGFGQTHPNAGAFGSRIVPEYEVEPPPHFERIAHYMPMMQRNQSFQYDSYKQGLPVGAGLVIRRQVWLDHAMQAQIIQGPVGQGFALKGEETEALSHLQQTTWEIWYNAEMSIVHRISKHRLEASYLLNFLKVIGLSQHRFRMLRFQPWQRPLVFPLLLLNDLRKIGLHLLKYRAAVLTDVVAACELQFFVGRLLSPFYIWRMLLAKRMYR